MDIKKLITISTLSVFLLAGCQAPQEEQKPETTQPTEEKAKKVSVVMPSAQNNSSIEKLGTIQALSTIDVKAESTGKVQSMNLQKGRKVSRNSVLAQLGNSLNTSINHSNYVTASRALENAKNQLKEQEKSHALALENAKLTVEQAQIGLNAAQASQKNLQRSTEVKQLNLSDQAANSRFIIREHLIDAAALTRNVLQQTSPQNSLWLAHDLDHQLRFVEQLGAYGDLDTGIRYAESLLSHTKGLIEQETYNQQFTYNNFHNYGTPYYQVTRRDVTDPSMAPGQQMAAAATQPQANQAQSQNFSALRSSASQLLSTLQADKNTLSQILQQERTIQDAQTTQNDNALSQIDVSTNQLLAAQKGLEITTQRNELEKLNLLNQITQLEGQLNNAKINASSATIVSPVNGVVTEKYVEKGDLVSAGQTIAVVSDLSKLKVVVSVLPQDLNQIARSQNITVKTENGYTTTGTITQLPVTFNNTSKTADVEITIDNSAPHLLQPNSLVTVLFGTIQDAGNKTLWLPLKSVMFKDTTFVYVLQNGKVAKKNVTTGAIKQTNVEITEGLTPQDKVITSTKGISEGDKVEENNPSKK